MKHIILFALFPVLLNSYAPLVPSGRLVTELSYSYFDTDHFYDKEGRSLDSFNSFQRHQITVNSDIGATPTDNLVLKAGYDMVYDHLNGNEYEINEGEFGWKRELYAWENAILSGEITAIAPLSDKYVPEIRYGKWGAQAGLMYAQTFTPFGSCETKITLDGLLAYRFYSGFPSDQIRSNISAWIDLSCHWQLLASSMVEYGLDNGTEPKNISFFFYNAKYRVWKGKIEAIYYLNERLAFSAGYMHHFIGERIAVGGEWYGKIMFCF